MAVESIGTSFTSTQNTLQRASLDQEDFIRLFLAQLSFQDPLEPVDNQEFLAQLLQFTNLDQTRQMNERLEAMLTFQSASQSVGLIGKTVEVLVPQGNTVVGKVTTVTFEQGLPVLAIAADSGEALTDISLSQIRLVRDGGAQ